jgi:ribonuclease PH
VQATAEDDTFDRAGLNRLLDLAGPGTARIFAAQRAALGRC